MARSRTTWRYVDQFLFLIFTLLRISVLISTWAQQWVNRNWWFLVLCSTFNVFTVKPILIEPKQTKQNFAIIFIRQIANKKLYRLHIRCVCVWVWSICKWFSLRIAINILLSSIDFGQRDETHKKRKNRNTNGLDLLTDDDLMMKVINQSQFALSHIHTHTHAYRRVFIKLYLVRSNHINTRHHHFYSIQYYYTHYTSSHRHHNVISFSTFTVLCLYNNVNVHLFQYFFYIIFFPFIFIDCVCIVFGITSRVLLHHEFQFIQR